MSSSSSSSLKNGSAGSTTTTNGTTTTTAKSSSSSSSSFSSLYSLSDVFITKRAYHDIAAEFHPYHCHDGNVLVHLLTTTLGIWGALQLALLYGYESIILGYAILVALTTPLRTTALLHTLVVAALTLTPQLQVGAVTQGLLLDDDNNNNNNTAAARFFLEHSSSWLEPNIVVCLAAMALGYGLQDLSHYIFQEKTYMQAYLGESKYYMVVIHSLWLLPLVLDSIMMRNFYLHYMVPRNRNIVTRVSSKEAVKQVREWIHKNVAHSRETTHVWPHRHEGTDGAVTLLEHDANIYDAFYKVFAKHHYDIRPVRDMNEIYVTAVGAKKDINSDAVFYTPHTDGPYWFLPGASLYRVLVGVTPNTMVRTRFNLQHSTQNQVVDTNGVLGFDYNRELHWIDHVPGESNVERRSLLKLHYIVYPKGWHRYGSFCAHLNTTYNTWARGNFLQTLQIHSVSDYVLAWWIWLTTWCNALFEEHVGWNNLVYVVGAYLLLSPTGFLVAVSFRHYLLYMTTFAFRHKTCCCGGGGGPPVAHGYLMRDAKLFKTMSMMMLAANCRDVVELPRDAPALLLCMMGWSVTLLATAQLGMVRTYFGSELGFVPPRWIDGFPYNVLPHPMIVGQLWAFAVMLWWWRDVWRLSQVALIVAHMACYTLHMVQEMMDSSYVGGPKDDEKHGGKEVEEKKKK